jgi:selenocysteine-specific elongation factor
VSVPRKNIMLGTAGHIDHGKTALVKLLTGCDTDTLVEEKQRGLTIDLGFAPCRLADRRIVGIVDVPGHADFIRNMVAGAHGIDVVILVVAADDGVMPQTREHLHILTLMGLSRGLVALTKIDLVEAPRRDAVVEDVRRLLAATSLADAPICPLSNLTGEGFDRFYDALNRIVDGCGERPTSGLFRVWVADVFTIRGFGTVITGIPSSGTVRVGDHLCLRPGDVAARVRRLEVYGEDATEGRAGECVALNLPEFAPDGVRRGMVLCSSEAGPAVKTVQGELKLLDTVKARLKDQAEVHLHIGTASVMARVAMLETGEMSAGQRRMVQLRLAEPLGVVPGERFVIRANVAAGEQSGLTTIGGGRVLGTGDMQIRRHKPATLETLARRRDSIDDPRRWCELMLRERHRPVGLAELALACQKRSEEITPLSEALRKDGIVLTTQAGALVHSEIVREASSRLRQALGAFHQTNPRRVGVEREELLSGLGIEAALFELAVESLLQAGIVERNGTLFSLAGWTARLSALDQQLCDRLAAVLQKAGLSSPTIEELAGAVGEPLPRVEAMLRVLAERGIIVRLGERLVMHQEAVEAARKLVLQLFARAPSFSTMEFRDALGVSRKYAVPLLDYLDSIRFTVRTGHIRTPGAEAKKLIV